ncbi:hypothetical protein [Mucilaginibacter paludis]|uniref:DUF5050 domain-containing protein n=1 Tax=Mucilaginibacter paludis DSM 18603 TaxID=714943 RepID=H1XZ94_9SPHI|nr:hypothetical protein [Mucilaginibacter paludis]EHQ25582.1 hypothetical protein Mucpa_1422 [Mucilaginibacter paludis DSM 18603]
MTIFKKLRNVLAFVIVGVLSVFLLFMYSTKKTSHQFVKNGGFKRIYKQAPVKYIGSKKIFSGFSQIAGYYKEGIYTYSKQNNLALYTDVTSAIDTISIALPAKSTTIANDCIFRNDTLYYFDSNSGKYHVFKIVNRRLKVIDSAKTAPSSFNPIVLDQTDILCKNFYKNSPTFEIVIYKKGIKAVESPKLFNDGIKLTDDGRILPYKNGFIYLCYFKNTILWLDKNLRLQFKSNTIDTVQNVPAVERISGTARYTYKTQPIFVNRYGQVVKDKLYVLSSLLADNDKKVSFTDTTILDVYDLLNKRNYLYSYKIPLPRLHSPASGFSFVGQQLYIILLNGYICVFK